MSAVYTAVYNSRSFFAYLPSPFFLRMITRERRGVRKQPAARHTHIRVHMYSYSYIDATDEPHIINIIRKRADVFFFLRSDEVLTELSAVDGQVERWATWMMNDRIY